MWLVVSRLRIVEVEFDLELVDLLFMFGSWGSLRLEFCVMVLEYVVFFEFEIRVSIC